MTITLTKLQLPLLTGASERPGGSLLPAPATLTVAPNQTRKATGQLIKLGLADEHPVGSSSSAWRADGDTALSASINAAGRALVVNVCAQASQQQGDGKPADAPAPVPMADHSAPAAKRGSNADGLISLLTHPEGASVDDVIAATGWLPHTARAAMTMLKKKDRSVKRFERRGASRYRIAEAS